MKLVIVESPTKARTISRYLGRGYEVMASYGHVRDLPTKELAVDVERNFEPKYVQVKRKNSPLPKMKLAAKKADKVVLATDLDREGEAIAWHVREILKKEGVKAGSFGRIVFHQITKQAIEKALAAPREVSIPLVNAQQARRVLDRLVGYKLSPLLWRKVRKGLSAGRVQSVTVKLVVDREREIEAFKPDEYWEVWVKVSRGQDGFWLKLARIEDKKAEIKTKGEAQTIEKDLKTARYLVAKLSTRQTKVLPPPPFTTSTLQQTAARRLRYSSKRTMRAAQGLYERGYITYHRTDSLSLAGEAVTQARKYAANKFGREYVPDKPRRYKTNSKLAQEAHEAIRPTKFSRDLEAAEIKGLDRDQLRVYELIWKRALATQMAQGLDEKTKLAVLAEGEKQYELRAEGVVVGFVGWRVLYPSSKPVAKKKAAAETRRANQVPSGLETGEELKQKRVDTDQKFTQPPPRYGEAGLIKALEEKGIGRPSTYAPTISTVQDRQYIEKLEGKFQPTPVGVAVTDYLAKYFKQIMDYEFTAKMESELDAIAAGEKDWVSVVREFYGPFEKKIKKATEKSERVKIATEKIGRRCPECAEGELVIRVGRYGKFISCNRFPECKYTQAYVETIEMPCPDCGQGEVVVKKTRRGKQFYGCSRYPKCKWASWNKPKAA